MGKKDTQKELAFDMFQDQEKMMIPIIQKGRKKLSGAQTTFNRLNKKIAKLKMIIDELPQREHVIKKYFDENSFCLFEQEAQLTDELLCNLDRVYKTARLTKKEKLYLPELILDECEHLDDLPFDEKRREALEEIRQDYIQISTGLSQEEIHKQGLESMLSFCEMLGLTPTEDMKNAKNPEEFFQAVYEAKRLVDEQENQNPSKKKKLSKREIEKEIQAEKTWKSIRGKYLELVKELHPDKEADETQRLLKEERMKQLTKAYQEKDLASLLRMQINWLEESAKEPIDQTDDVLKQYNKVLQAQVDRLEQEYDLLCNAPFPGILGAYAGFRKYSLKELPGVLEQMNNLHRKEIANLETYVALSRNVKGVKLCLKDFIYMQEHKGLDTIFDNLWDL